ncbi:MAG TPA: SurA N-terminal domain-containing protein [Pseudogracilibacillus sp.]|nr:SurA N-terminal domain-containing protein [Pseudogracilibacillus sp.]
MLRKFLLVFTTILMSVLLVACGGNKEEAAPEVPQVEISDEEKFAEDEVIVTVNDEDVTGRTYNLVYSQLKLEAVQTGQDLSDEEIKELTIESIIDRQLLMQKAKEEGIVVTEEEVAEELEQIKAENEEGIQTILEQYQITEDLLQHQLVYEFTYEQYVDETIDIELTKEEVEEIYKEMKEENEDLPDLMEVYDTFKNQLESIRKGEELQSRIEKFKGESTIETHI